jgi:hypothetical protein
MPKYRHPLHWYRNKPLYTQLLLFERDSFAICVFDLLPHRVLLCLYRNATDLPPSLLCSSAFPHVTKPKPIRSQYPVQQLSTFLTQTRLIASTWLEQ